MLYTLIGIQSDTVVSIEEKKKKLDDLLKHDIKVDGSKRKFIYKNTRGFGLNK
tara:strand:- start:2149 stop:2307 length:159 start_codon:yes stop_codon:yes gene_type:complete